MTSFAHSAGIASEPGPRQLSRRGLLKVGGALLGSTAALGGTTGRARAASQENQEIVGSWLVKIASLRGPHGLSLLTFSPDGGVLQTIAHYEEENDESTGHGVWARTARGEFAFTLVLLRIDEHGRAVGTVKIRGGITLGATSDDFSARYQVDRLDLDGTLVRSGSPTAEGTRIRMEPMA